MFVYAHAQIKNLDEKIWQDKIFLKMQKLEMEEHV